MAGRVGSCQVIENRPVDILEFASLVIVENNTATLCHFSDIFIHIQLLWSYTMRLHSSTAYDLFHCQSTTTVHNVHASAIIYQYRSVLISACATLYTASFVSFYIVLSWLPVTWTVFNIIYPSHIPRRLSYSRTQTTHQQHTPAAFCICDLDLGPMTLMYETDLDI